LALVVAFSVEEESSPSNNKKTFQSSYNQTHPTHRKPYHCNPYHCNPYHCKSHSQSNLPDLKSYRKPHSQSNLPDLNSYRKPHSEPDCEPDDGKPHCEPDDGKPDFPYSKPHSKPHSFPYHTYVSAVAQILY
jgi:hypothetical protein